MDVPNSQPIINQKTLNVKLPNDIKGKNKRDGIKTSIDPAVYYEAEQHNQDEYNRKQAKFLRKAEPILIKAMENLTQAMEMFKSGKINKQPS